MSYEQSPNLVKSYKTTAAVNPYRVVTFGETKGTVKEANAATDVFAGISANLGGMPERVIDINKSGVVLAEAGAAVKTGDYLVCGKDGKVSAWDGTTAAQQIIGIAETDGAGVGSAVEVFISPFVSGKQS